MIDLDIFTDEELQTFLQNMKTMVKDAHVPKKTIEKWVNAEKRKTAPVTTESTRNIWRNFLDTFPSIYK